MFKHFMTLLQNHTLNHKSSFDLANYMMDKDTDEAYKAALLSALSFQTLNSEIIIGFSKALLANTKPLKPLKTCVMDVCGTGGDGSNTFNISTTVALLLSNVITVVKHGNGSISSKSGSSDLLTALKVSLPDTEDQIRNMISKFNFTFLFAPMIHPVLKGIMPMRKKLAIPTVFNVIGPLCNPYPLDYQVIGVYSEQLLEPMAKAMQYFNIKKGAVIHGHNGLDELSISGPNKVVIVTPSSRESIIVDPKSYGIKYQSLESIEGGTPNDNALITKNILKGQPGPCSDVVALNTGLALYICGETSSIDEGVKRAYRMLKSQVTYDMLLCLNGGYHGYLK